MSENVQPNSQPDGTRREAPPVYANGDAEARRARLEILVDRFQALFAEIGPHSEFPMDELYEEDVSFADPFHNIEGRAGLTRYFDKMNQTLERATFRWHDRAISDERAFVTWTMEITLKRPRKTLTLSGVTHVVLGRDKIAQHRDYFDTGVATFEQFLLTRPLARLLRSGMG